MQDLSKVVDEVLPALERLEEDRLTYLQKRGTWCLAVLTPALVIAFGLGIVFFPFGFFSVVPALIIAGISYHFMAGKHGKAYLENYKKNVMGSLASLIDPGLQYDPNRGIDEVYFRNSELFSTRPDRYRTEDLIYGSYGLTGLQLGEIHAEEKRVTRDKDGKTQTTYITIFKGLMLIADFHKHFQGRTFVFPDFAEKALGGLGRALQKLGGRSGTETVRMEDAEFEKHFAVYATDQIEARYILSPAMMRRILDLREKYGKDVRLAFKDSSVWIAVPHHSPYLEPNMKISATDRGQIESIMTEMSSFLRIVEELDLNTRIWTKH